MLKKHSGLLLAALALPAVLSAQTGNISSLDPSSAFVGSPDFTLSVNGTGFGQDAQVVWKFGQLGSVALPTQWVSANLLRATVSADKLAQGGTVPVAVVAGLVSSNVANFTILPAQGLIITTACPLPNAILSTPYSQTLAAAGGAPPYIWSILEGTAPAPGLTLSSSGTLSGTPTTTGTFNFSLRVIDGQQRNATKGCSLTVGSTTNTVFITNLIPAGTVAGSPALQLTVNGLAFRQGAVVYWNGEPLATTYVSPVRLTAVVPADLLAASGRFLVRVQQPAFVTTEFSNEVEFTVAAPVSITSACPLPGATVNSPYSTTIASTGGFGPYTYTITLGTLPQGLSLASNGTLSGTPTEAGVFDLTLLTTDTGNNTSSKPCSLTVLGPLVVSKQAFQFDASGEKLVLRDTASFSCPSRVTGCTVTASASGQNRWINVTLSGSRTPALLLVEVDARGMAPGTYRDTITVSSPEASNSPVSLPVVFTVGASSPPQVAVRPGFLQFAFPRNGTGPSRRVLEIANTGSGSLSYSASVQAITGGNWASISATNGSAAAGTPGRVIVTARPPAGTAPGTYKAALNITTAAGTSTVPLLMLISNGLETILSSQTGFTLTTVAGGSAPPPVPLRVLTGGNTGFFWQATKSTFSGGDWLKVDPTTDAARPGNPSTTMLSVDPGSLAPDLYFGEVQIASASADNSPRLVSLAMRILDPAVSPGLLLNPSGLIFTAAPSGSTPGSQDIVVTNLSKSVVTIDYALNGDPAIWFANATSRSVPAGGTRRISVAVNTTNKPAGVYRASLSVQASNDPNIQVADLALVIATGQKASADKQADREATGCTPTKLVPVSTGQQAGFVTPGGLPMALEVTVVDDCGDPLTGGVVTAGFSTNAPAPVALVPSGDGRWSGTWWVAQSTAMPVSITFTADDPDRGLTGSLNLTGSITATSGIPVIGDGGVVSDASFAAGNPLAPGGVVAIFGSNLATGTSQATTLPLPATLGVTQVNVAGRNVPLFFAADLGSYSQANLMLPFDLIPNTIQQLSVRRGTRRSNYAEFAVAAAQPSVFTTTLTGSGQGIIVDNANPLVIADAAHPIARGAVAVIYTEGLGAVDQPILAGQPTPGLPLSNAVAPVSVAIGGQPAQVLFAGLTPFLAGLYQIDVFVPAGVTPGNSVPVVITQAGQTSPVVTVAVQ